MLVLEGISVSPGVAIGNALVIDNRGYGAPPRLIEVTSVPKEIERLNQAFEAAAADIEKNRETVSQELGPQFGAIFDAHLQMVRDASFHDELVELIEKQFYSPEYAVSSTLRRHAKVFENLESGYLAERAHDIIDIEQRLLWQLGGAGREQVTKLTCPVLVMAHNLTPGETVNFDRKYVLGLVTEIGGSGSHTAIVASAMGIPAVVGTGTFLPEVGSGDLVIVDGDHGRVILNPTEETLEQYEQEIEEHRTFSAALEEVRDLPAETADGVRLQLLSNIELPHEAPQLANDCDGIGLYRTEFLYLGTNRMPTEDDHYQAYCEVIRAMGDKPVVIRTLDLGADKFAWLEHHPNPEQESNPFLGLRSIRLSLRNLTHFRTQLRAIMRASVEGNVRIMFPLVSTIGELRQAKMVLAHVCEDLEEQGIPYDRDLRTGIMVEVPSVALLVDHFIPEVDFFSIGTNDLVQYSLAVDRGNRDVANLYSNSDPSVLKLIKMVVDSSSKGDVPVSACGQMCSNPIYLMLLLGMGLRSLSVTPSAIPEIKKVCRSVTIDQCESVAERALTFQTAREVTRYLRSELKKTLPEFIV